MGEKAGQKRQSSSSEQYSEGKLRVILDEIEEATNGETSSRSVLTFGDKISTCLEDLSPFSQSCKEIHDVSGCDLEPCTVKCFCDELFSFFSLGKGFFIRYLYKMADIF